MTIQRPESAAEEDFYTDMNRAESQFLHSEAARKGVIALGIATFTVLSSVVTGFICYDNGKEIGRVEGHEEFLASQERRDLDLVACVYMAEARQRNPGLYAEAALAPCTEPIVATTTTR